MPIPDFDRHTHHAWLRELTAVPTAAGKEHGVIAWIDRWLEARDGLTRRADAHGNIELALDPDASPALSDDSPVFFTAHMDHPAFTVERIVAPGTLELAFRGGVMAEYFENARVLVHTASGKFAGTLAGPGDQTDPFKSYLCDLDAPPEDETEAPAIGDTATWALPEVEILPHDHDGHPVDGGCLHTNACDDLAALVAALAALDELRAARARGETTLDARVLLTRAEEVGFIGAIGASRDAFMPADARIIALETSRSFRHDSPIGGGPIVRVGDRVSTFSPTLTAAVAKVAEQIAGGSAHILAIEKNADKPAWRWQRKLMPGGACEASVYCAFGYESTCVCLPLGNYHNMADLDAVQAGTNAVPAKVGREVIALSDFDGMVDLLYACGLELPPTGGFRDRTDKLWDERKFVLA